MKIQFFDQDLKNEFKKRDKNNDGLLDISEIKDIFVDVYEANAHVIKESKEEWVRIQSETFLNSLDYNNDNNLTYDEFVKWLNKREVSALINEFKKRDKNNDGFLDIEEIREIFGEEYERHKHDIKEKKEDWIKKRSEDFLSSVDLSGDNKIAFNEFEYFFSRRYPYGLIDEFKKRDKNKDGYLDMDEIKDIFAGEYEKHKKDIKENKNDWIKKHSEQFLNMLDVDMDKRLTFQEFLEFFAIH